MAKPNRICSIEGCDKPIIARGWCSPHYYRWVRHKDPLAGHPPSGAPIEYMESVVLSYEGDECLVWPYTRDHNGYGRIHVDGSGYQVSRLVCEREHGPAPTAKHEAAHNCGKGHLGCVAKRHLRWATHKENMADRERHGTVNRGERNGNSRLTSEQVIKIKEMKGIVSRNELAAMFRVRWQTIYDIQRGRTWKHVE